MALTVRELTGPDLTGDFLDTLSGLSDVGLTVPQALEVLRQRLRLGVRTYIALWEGEVVGTASLVVELKFIHGGGRVGHLEDVAVRNSARNRGVGSALVKHVIDDARRLGCYKVILNCFPERVSFYERLGFHYHDHGMRMDLGGGSRTCASASLAIPTAGTVP
jgi:glucosamine-phosphate N-acetyltransferase